MATGFGFCPSCGTPLSHEGQMFCAGCGGSLAVAAKAIPAAAPAALVPPPAPEAAPPPWASAATTPPPYAPPPPVSGQGPWTAQPAPSAPRKSGANPILFLAVIALVVAVAGVGYVAMNGSSKGSPVPGGSGGPTATSSVVATTLATPTTAPRVTPTVPAVVMGGIGFSPDNYSCASGGMIVMVVSLPGSLPGSLQVTAVIDGEEISTRSISADFTRDADGTWIETEKDDDGSNFCDLGVGKHVFAVEDPSGKVLAQGILTLRP